MIAHSTVFYLLSLGAALLLLALAFIEPPSVSSTAIPILVGMTQYYFIKLSVVRFIDVIDRMVLLSVGLHPTDITLPIEGRRLS